MDLTRFRGLCSVFSTGVYDGNEADTISGAVSPTDGGAGGNRAQCREPADVPPLPQPSGVTMGVTRGRRIELPLATQQLACTLRFRPWPPLPPLKLGLI